MSKLFEMYKKLKNQDKTIVYLFKSGIFYISLDDDAKMLAEKYGFKLTNLNMDIVKCGFPCNSFDKYYIMFTNDNLKFKIIEDNTIFSGDDLLKNKKITELLNKINSVDINNLSVSEAYKFIEDIKKHGASL